MEPGTPWSQRTRDHAKAEEIRSDLKAKVSSATQDTLRAGLLRTQLDQRVSQQTQQSIRTSFASTGGSNVDSPPSLPPVADQSTPAENEPKSQAVLDAIACADKVKQEAELTRQARESMIWPEPAPAVRCGTISTGVLSKAVQVSQQREEPNLGQQAPAGLQGAPGVDWGYAMTKQHASLLDAEVLAISDAHRSNVQQRVALKSSIVQA